LPLAVTSYQGVRLRDDASLLNLAWTADERDVLDVDVDGCLRAVLEDARSAMRSSATAVSAPGSVNGARLSASVAAFFETPAEGFDLHPAPGVGPLLAALAPVAHGRTGCVLGDSYPDFPHWLEQAGATCTSVRGTGSVLADAEHLRRERPAVVLLERPSLFGDHYRDPEQVAALCRALPGVPVVVDESNANYCPPAFSAVRCVPDVDTLVVLRGLTKAYGLGGLRLAFAVSSSGLHDLLARRLQVPVDRFALLCAARLLAAGDATVSLREAVALGKERATALLRGVGLRDLQPSSQHLPYVLAWDGEAEGVLANRGVQGKRHPVRLPPSGRRGFPYRLSVPLSEDRMRELVARLSP